VIRDNVDHGGVSMEPGYDLSARMRELGAPDPDAWAESERGEGIAQEARWLFLRRVWPEFIDGNASMNLSLPSARRAVESGAAAEDVALAMRAAACQAVFGVLFRVFEGCDLDAPPDAPGWRLMEIRFDNDGEGHLTGRDVGSLHEDLVSLDPSGREGADLWQ
jgi:hypothetical protein